MRYLCGLLTAALVFAATPIAQAQISVKGEILTGSGLVCDTKEQAQRFASLMQDDVRKTLITVNREAGDERACVLATIGFVPGSKVGEVDRDGKIVDIIEIKVVAVAGRLGLHIVEPKTYYTVVLSNERSV